LLNYDFKDNENKWFSSYLVWRVAKMKVPDSMEDCLYFTNRGEILAWVYRKECPECHKDKMGKPVVKGKVKTRADKYVCPECDYEEPKQEHEESLHLESKYTCPECGKDGESTCPYKRKSYKGVQAFVVNCQHCQADIPLTKKLKEPKKKKPKK
jgi:predicted RNA-binding Zn-ribbon protein involved in translation (DUF1610 family)